ncbi:MAG: response regulator transcription factor [Coriobacteriales bacterium]|jgi:DNA-binding response OmpR family regulator|nr:response regulator transcription factor [Coriobacteriales bacterium]
MNILVVEDQKRLAMALSAILKDAGYRVDVVFDGRHGLEYALVADYDAIVLDVMLPEKNGFELVSELRRAGRHMPIIMLTARDSLRDKVFGLDQGADDYLTKPFNPPELLARLRALTRRQGTVLVETLVLGNTRLDLENADLSLLPDSAGNDTDSPKTHEGNGTEGATGTDTSSETADATGKRLKAPTQKPPQPTAHVSVHLTRREFEVLKILMSNAGRTWSKQDILRKVWSDQYDAEENSVEAYISFLRKKLHHLGSNLAIVTLRQLGYRIEIADAG